MKNSFVALSLFFCSATLAQVKTVSLDSALNIAYSNNKSLKSVSMQTEYYRLQKKTSSELPKTDISLMYGQYNAYYKKDNNITINQTIPFPTVFGAKSSLAEAQLKGAELQKATTKNELTYQIKQVYYQLLFCNTYREILNKQDSMYVRFAKSAELRLKAGDASLLEKTSADSRLAEVKNKIRQTESQIDILNIHLQALMGITYDITIEPENSVLRALTISDDSTMVNSNPQLLYIKQQVEIAEKEKSVIAKEGLPEFQIGYFNQTLYGVPLDASNTALAGTGDRFQGIQVGVIIPLWFVPQSNKNKMAQTQIEMNQFAFEGEQILFQSNYEQALKQFLAAKTNLEYYENSALSNADLIEKQSQTAYAKGEIGMSDYLLGLQQVISVRENYAMAMNDYNQTVIYLEYLVGK